GGARSLFRVAENFRRGEQPLLGSVAGTVPRPGAVSARSLFGIASPGTGCTRPISFTPGAFETRTGAGSSHQSGFGARGNRRSRNRRRAHPATHPGNVDSAAPFPVLFDHSAGCRIPQRSGHGRALL